MTPSALFTGIMFGTDGSALWAGPLIVGVLNDNIDSLILHFEINAGDFPRGLYTQQLAVVFF